jgi:pimeloyl-ACP methyl ester carboxylesterase
MTLAALLAVAIVTPLTAQQQQNSKHLRYTTLGSSKGNTLSGLMTYTGTFADGATYLIEVPAHWNGDMLLYSHGYVPPGDPNDPADNGDPLVGFYLLSHGYALAGSSYAGTGWAIQDAFTDQIAVLDKFAQLVGQPSRTIAWGHSMGGIITAGLVQKFPERFSGALPFCGPLAGSAGIWNEFLDSAFAFKTLLAPNSELQLVHITDPANNFGIAEQALSDAQATPQGMARVALAAALFDSSGWIEPFEAPPDPKDYSTLEQTSSNHCRGFRLAYSLPFVLNWKHGREGTLRGTPVSITKSSSNFLSIMRR